MTKDLKFTNNNQSPASRLVKKPMTSPDKPRPEVKRKPLSPDEYRQNNRAVFNNIKRQTELDPSHPERLELSPITLRALELYTTDISLIPRGKHNKTPMIDYFSAYQTQFNANSEFPQHFSFAIDQAGNVLFHLNAHGGEIYQTIPSIMIQGHYDMVCAAQEGFPDPAEHGVALQIKTLKNKKTGKEELWMSGIHTSAGIDCAWGVTWGLAYIEDLVRSGKPHPEISFLITSDEEAGLLGAKGFSFTKEQLDQSGNKEMYLLNVDNDKLDGLVGSAGLAGSKIVLPVERTPLPDGMTRLAVGVFGSISGHSGDERDRIDNGRWNKISVATELIQELTKQPGLEDLRLIAMNGGEADNAIPMQVPELVLAVPQGSEDRVFQLMQDMAAQKNTQAEQDLTRFQQERPEKAEDDEADVITIKRIEESEKTRQLGTMKKASTSNALALLSALSDPKGVLKIEWDKKDAEAIETSSNLATITTDKNGLEIIISSRSSEMSQLQGAQSRPAIIEKVATQFGAIYEDMLDLSVEPWSPDFTDPIVSLQQQAAQKALGPETKFKVTTIHAGVEVKTLRDKFQSLLGNDFVLHATCNGPKYKGAHSFNEIGNVASLEEFGQFESILLDEIVAHELGKNSSARRGDLAA